MEYGYSSDEQHISPEYEEADRRVRLDPYDPSTFRHAGQCEYRYTSDPALLRAILKVRDGAGAGYWWVECGTCECGWQFALRRERRVTRRETASR